MKIGMTSARTVMSRPTALDTVSGLMPVTVPIMMVGTPTGP